MMLATKLRVLVILLLALAAVSYWPMRSPRAEGIALVVPKDSSLPIAEYTELGVPDPRRPWTASEYERTLRILGELPRVRLPRASGPSRLLFDRLLLSYRHVLELPYSKGLGEGASKESPPRGFRVLYSPKDQDGLLFDQEVIAIRAEMLSRTLEMVPTRTKILALAKGFAKMMERANSEAERANFSEKMRRTEEGAEQVSKLVRSQATELLVAASIPPVTDAARKLLLRKAQAPLRKLPQFLEARDFQRVVALLKASARSTANASIGSELLDLARELEKASADP